MDHNEVIAAIDVLGDQLLSLGRAARELPAPDFINKALQVMHEVVPHHAAWWGLSVNQRDGRRPTIHQTEFIGLPLSFASEWRALSLHDYMAQQLGDTAGYVQRYLFTHDYNPSEFAETVTFFQKHELRHGMTLLLGEPFTGHHFFVAIYRRSGLEFSDIEATLFGQLIRHIIQLWRHKMQDELAISAAQDMFQAALVRADGRVLSIGMHLCEAIYTQWPEWNGVILPETLVAAFVDLPRRERLGRVMVDITERAGHIYLELVGISCDIRLSPRESRVAHLYATGKSYKEIARQVSLTPATVRTYLQRAYLHLGVKNKIQLASALAEAGLSPD